MRTGNLCAADVAAQVVLGVLVALIAGDKTMPDVLMRLGFCVPTALFMLTAWRSATGSRGWLK